MIEFIKLPWIFFCGCILFEFDFFFSKLEILVFVNYVQFLIVLISEEIILVRIEFGTSICIFLL